MAEADALYLNDNPHARARVVVETRTARENAALRAKYPNHRIERSAPKREVPLSRRAKRPSIASRITASMTQATASSKRPSRPSLMAVTPLHSARSVIRLGSR